MPYWASLLYCAAGLAAVGRAFATHREIELLPTMGWLGAMAVPYLVQASLFPPAAASLQGWGVSLFGVALLAGDILFERRGSIVSRSKDAPLWPVAAAATLALLFIVAIHLLLVPHVPLFEYWMVEHDTPILAQYREEYSKLLDVPAFMRYLFNWPITILGPIAIYLFFLAKKYLYCMAVAIFTYLYAAASLAKFQLMFLTVILIVIAVGRLGLAVRRKIILAGLLLLLVFLGTNLAVLYANPVSLFNYVTKLPVSTQETLAEDDPRRVLTLGDRYRLRPFEVTDSMSYYEQRVEYIFYREFLSPADVSNRWYSFFPEFSGGFAGLASIFPWWRPAGQAHPANRVAVWAYIERFPGRYLQSAHAYASIDADAFARQGPIGWIVAACILLVARWGLKVLYVRDEIGDVLYFIGLAMLTLLPAHASIQAILISHGLGLVLALQVLWIGWQRRLKPARSDGPGV